MKSFVLNYEMTIRYNDLFVNVQPSYKPLSIQVIGFLMIQGYDASDKGMRR